MKSFFSLLCICAGALFATSVHAAPSRVIDAKPHHLGNTKVNYWPGVPEAPEGFTLTVKFDAKANAREMTLSLKQRDVDVPTWAVLLNGKKIADLKKRKDLALEYYAIPPGELRDGENTLEISVKNSGDDIAVSDITLHDASFRELLQKVTISVVDRANNRPLPARVNITDGKMVRQIIYHEENPRIAVRAGVLYTTGEPTTISLPAGEYQVHAAHGMEWSQDHYALKVEAGKPAEVRLGLKREVDTAGWVAADTHLHTLTFSGHGDATIDERMVTLAAEGVELAIATDHNHQTDYTPYQAKLKLSEHFTPVTGNEVTTKLGHFNSFPLPPGKDIPDNKETNWVKLVAGIRAKGAKVVILNHPRWPDIARGPFGVFGLNRASGERASKTEFTFDATELVNSTVGHPDPLYVMHDWFALLNRGERIAGVGSSDTHDVVNPTGGARTYVPSRTDDPARINIDESCDAFRAGNVSVSLGIFSEIKVDGRYGMGQQVPVKNGQVSVDLRIASPSWITPQRAMIFVNGERVTEKDVPAAGKDQPTNVKLQFTIKAPAEDAHLVCAVYGSPPNTPAWFAKFTNSFAATNPIYLDVDGDGRYTTPRDTAIARLKKAGDNRDEQWSAMLRSSDAVAVQMLAEMRMRLEGADRAALDAKIQAEADKRPPFQEFLRYLPTVK